MIQIYVNSNINLKYDELIPNLCDELFAAHQA